MIPPRSVRAVSAHWPASEPTQLAPLGSACTSLWRKAPKARGPFFLFLQWMLESLPTGGLDKFYGFFSNVASSPDLARLRAFCVSAPQARRKQTRSDL